MMGRKSKDYLSFSVENDFADGRGTGPKDSETAAPIPVSLAPAEAQLLVERGLSGGLPPAISEGCRWHRGLL